jgi:hypothetical protein
MESFDKTSGRSIEGIIPVEEKFSLLKEGRDYEFILKNEFVDFPHDIKDFVYFVNPEEGELEKTIEAPHWRAMTDNEVESSLSIPYGIDKAPQPFFSVSSKGIGYLKPKALDKKLNDYETWTLEDTEGGHGAGGKVLGLSSKLDYFLYRNENIIDKSMFLASQGLRTEIYLGVEKTKRLYHHGELKTIRELKDLGVIPDRRDFVPHIAQRLLKTNTRVEEVYRSDERREELFERAFNIFNKEQDFYGTDIHLDINKMDDQKKFYTEYIRRCAKNMAVLINTGYINTGAHSSNMTLAGEMVDIGHTGHWSVDAKDKNGWVEEYKGLRMGHIKDMRDLIYTIKFLRIAMRKAGLERPSKEECLVEFVDAIKESLDDKKSKEQGTDSVVVEDFAEKMFKAVIVDGMRLPSLFKHEITEWPDIL